MGFKLPNGVDLSEEQVDIINLPTNKDWVIKGAPGTGKTVMAIYRARQAANMSKVKPVLLIVYNKPLMCFISTAVKGNDYKRIEVCTYYQWVYDIYKEYNLGKPKKDADTRFDWASIDYKMNEIGKKYSHVIIDEAQDFPIELLRILKKHSDNMTCFIDPNQAIEYGKTDVIKTLNVLCREAPYTLTRNFRNTAPIRDLSALFCHEGEPAPSFMPGKKPVAIKCRNKDFDDLYDRITDIILRNKEKNIGIIVNSNALNNAYNALTDLLPGDVTVQMYKTMTDYTIDFDLSGVKIVSFGTAKGLEFDMVIIPQFDKIKMQDGGVIDENRVYVAVSRAINELYLIYWSEKPSPGKVNTMGRLTQNRDLLEWK